MRHITTSYVYIFLGILSALSVIITVYLFFSSQKKFPLKVEAVASLPGCPVNWNFSGQKQQGWMSETFVDYQELSRKLLPESVLDLKKIPLSRRPLAGSPYHILFSPDEGYLNVDSRDLLWSNRGKYGAQSAHIALQNQKPNIVHVLASGLTHIEEAPLLIDGDPYDVVYLDNCLSWEAYESTVSSKDDIERLTYIATDTLGARKTVLIEKGLEIKMLPRSRVSAWSDFLSLYKAMTTHVTKTSTQNDGKRDYVVAWGANYLGQLGREKPTIGEVPAAYSTKINSILEPDFKIRQIAKNGDGVCILRDDASVWCFSYFVHSNTESSYTRIHRIDMPPIKYLTGGNVSCAITMQDDLVCWGGEEKRARTRHQYSEGYYKLKVPPGYTVDAKALHRSFRQVYAGPHHYSCLITDQGELWCQIRQKLFPVPLQSPVTDVTIDYQEACARLADKTVWCWQKKEDARPSKILVDREAVKEISGACILKEDGTVWCWPDSKHIGLPKKIEIGAGVPLESIKKIISEDQRHCALTHEGNVFCWGSDGMRRQLSSNQYAVPVNIFNAGDYLMNVRDIEANQGAFYAHIRSYTGPHKTMRIKTIEDASNIFFTEILHGNFSGAKSTVEHYKHIVITGPIAEDAIRTAIAHNESELVAIILNAGFLERPGQEKVLLQELFSNGFSPLKPTAVNPEILRMLLERGADLGSIKHQIQNLDPVENRKALEVIAEYSKQEVGDQKKTEGQLWVAE